MRLFELLHEFLVFLLEPSLLLPCVWRMRPVVTISAEGNKVPDAILRL